MKMNNYRIYSQINNHIYNDLFNECFTSFGIRLMGDISFDP
jgi:hypothetical protein